MNYFDPKRSLSSKDEPVSPYNKQQTPNFKSDLS